MKSASWVRPSPWASALIAVMFLGLLYSKLKRESPWVGKPAPAFSLPLAYGDGAEGGDRVRLSDLKGHVVLLDFWASWCGPCRDSIPSLNQLAARLKDKGVQVYGVNSESMKPARVAQIAKEWGIEYPVLHDLTAETLASYDIEVLPSVFVVDRDGIIRKMHGGAPTAERLIAEVEKVLD